MSEDSCNSQIVQPTPTSRADYEPPWGADDAIRAAEAAGTVGNFDDLVALCSRPETDALFYAVSEGGSVFTFSEDSLAEAAQARRSLESVRMLAMRLRRTDPENAAHLLRFCAEAGVTGNVLRSEGT